MRDRDQFKRDLPRPPAQTYDNYASALAEALQVLDTAWNVAPEEGQRDVVDDVRQTIRNELLESLEHTSDGDGDE